MYGALNVKVNGKTVGHAAWNGTCAHEGCPNRTPTANGHYDFGPSFALRAVATPADTVNIAFVLLAATGAPTNDSLEKAVDLVGRQACVADACGLSRATVGSSAGSCDGPLAAASWSAPGSQLQAITPQTDAIAIHGIEGNTFTVPSIATSCGESVYHVRVAIDRLPDK